MSVRLGLRRLLSLAWLPLTVSVSLLSLVSMTACSDGSSELGASEQSGQQAAQAQQDVAEPTGAGIAIDVYKSPTCGCCGKWVTHAEQNGFSPTTHHPEDLNKLKVEHGIAPQYQSCHTAVSQQGYVFEGHIPARYIHEFLAAPPADALGLAVPAMPVGSPGMEVDDRFMPYQVLLLKRDGSVAIFAEVGSLAQQYE